MYDYNSVDSKLILIDELNTLIEKLSSVSTRPLTCAEAIAISDYLVGIKQDLTEQVAPEIAKRNGTKRYTYRYLEEGIVIMADNGAEADREFKKLNGNKAPAGDIELTDMVTGRKDLIMKLDLGEPVNF